MWETQWRCSRGTPSITDVSFLSPTLDKRLPVRCHSRDDAAQRGLFATGIAQTNIFREEIDEGTNAGGQGGFLA